MARVHSSTLSSPICDIFVHTHRQCSQPVEQSSPYLRHVHCLVLQPDLQLHLTTSNNDVGAGSLSVRIGNNVSPCLYQPQSSGDISCSCFTHPLLNLKVHIWTVVYRSSWCWWQNFGLYRRGTAAYVLVESLTSEDVQCGIVDIWGRSMCHPGDPCRFAPMPCPAVTTSARVLLCLENISACSMKSLLVLINFLPIFFQYHRCGVAPQDSVNKQHTIAYLWTKNCFHHCHVPASWNFVSSGNSILNNQ